jgi:DNA polymerase beta
MKASKLGMHLNEFGLWRWNSNKPRSADGVNVDAVSEVEIEEGDVGGGGFWQLIRATTEEEIFEELGVGFVEPHRRNFTFINKRAVKPSSGRT